MDPNDPSSSALVQVTPGQTLQTAIDDFIGILTVDQRRELQDVKVIPNADAVLVFTAQLDAKTKIAALVWGSVRLTMLVVSNFVSFYDAASELFMNLGSLCPRFAEYQILYPNSIRRQNSLSNFHRSIVYCCKHVIEASQRPSQMKLLKSFWESFEQEFKPDMDNIRRCSTDVNADLKLAKAQADHRYQQLQSKERKRQSSTRQMLSKCVSRTDDQFDALALERDEQRARRWNRKDTDIGLGERRQKLLDSLASVIDNILTEKHTPDVFVSFFFPRFDDRRSLRTEIQMALEKMLHTASSRYEELIKLLRTGIASLRMFYIVIDALDECEREDRHDLFESLSSTISDIENVKTFLVSRDNISREIKRMFPLVEHVSMSFSTAQSEIAVFVEDAINERLENEDLVVGDPDLLNQVKQALLTGADRMFLWVTFQINEICSQHCDDEIRMATQNLPKDLTETLTWIAAARRPLSLDEIREAIFIEVGQQYSRPERFVNNIQYIGSWCESLVEVDEEHKTVHFAHHSIQQFFLGKSSASQFDKFHLKLADADNHLGEICVTYLNFNDFETTVARRPRPLPSITPTGIARSTLPHRLKAASLLLLSKSTQHIQAEAAAVALAGTMASFETTTAMEVVQVAHPAWELLTQLVLHSNPLAKKRWESGPRDIGDSEIVTWMLRAKHYSLIRWLVTCDQCSFSHIRNIMRFSVKEGDPTMIDIALKHDSALFASIYVDEPLNTLFITTEGDNLGFVERLLDAGVEMKASLAKGKVQTARQEAADIGGKMGLKAAAEDGNLKLVHRLLRARVDAHDPISWKRFGVNTTWWFSQSALEAAVRGGDLDVFDRLLKSGADVNAWTKGRTALQTATQCGSLDIVDRLLEAGADINAVTKLGNKTARQVAAAGSHLGINHRLIEAEAKMNAADYIEYEDIII
ncbi:hypothetical protein EDB81DRAFT_845847 [Dactylonectria macrodidyma]|uniref:Ankyrin repeat protein n=1 Tax=Dactylonectria macrodidyma TaxID=307937 RepID=A0A9P9E5A8_9HYPO|nr:hypothetical protein EDB81DRAFT_845847 [Dactylonectria macrodidyma]